MLNMTFYTIHKDKWLYHEVLAFDSLSQRQVSSDNRWCGIWCELWHYSDVIMGTMASQITSLTIVYTTIYPGADQIKQLSPASLAFGWGIHRGPRNSPHKWPVTWIILPFDDVIMVKGAFCSSNGTRDHLSRQEPNFARNVSRCKHRVGIPRKLFSAAQFWWCLPIVPSDRSWQFNVITRVSEVIHRW